MTTGIAKVPGRRLRNTIEIGLSNVSHDRTWRIPGVRLLVVVGLGDSRRSIAITGLLVFQVAGEYPGRFTWSCTHGLISLPHKILSLSEIDSATALDAG
jgi:hypothetical protein